MSNEDLAAAALASASRKVTGLLATFGLVELPSMVGIELWHSPDGTLDLLVSVAVRLNPQETLGAHAKDSLEQALEDLRQLLAARQLVPTP